MVKREAKKTMKIGELAQAAQCSVETIRYYETGGLLPRPERGGNNYRLYGRAHLRRLIFIRNCRMLDMSHTEIIGLLKIMDEPATDCSSVNALLDEHIVHVEVRLQELQRLKEQLALLRKKCQHKVQVKDCLILQGLSETQRPLQMKNPSVSRTTHL
jgi:Cd(II)/Pb(II)-responsive transcriptional regulator